MLPTFSTRLDGAPTWLAQTWQDLRRCLATLPLRLLPSIALRILTAHNFTRDYRARTKKWRLFLMGLDLAKEVNCHFLENERGDL